MSPTCLRPAHRVFILSPEPDLIYLTIGSDLAQFVAEWQTTMMTKSSSAVQRCQFFRVRVFITM